MGEYQLVRQWKIIRTLQASQCGMTVAELSGLIAQGKRTIYRDLNALMNAGFPIYSLREDGHSKWKLVDGHKADSLMPLTPAELVSLHMAREALKVYKGSIFHDGFQSIFDKISKMIPAASKNYLEKMDQTVKAEFLGSKNYSAIGKTIAAVLNATVDHRRIEITYLSASKNEKTTRMVEPHSLIAKNYDLYLVGYCHMRQALRTFALDRIKFVRLLEENFECGPHVLEAGHEAQSFKIMPGQLRTVRVRLSSSVSRTVKERKWHPSQQLRSLKNGSVIVTFLVPINHEIISWIMGYGSKALVIEPLSLRIKILQEIRGMLKRYAVKRSTKRKIDESIRATASEKTC